MSTMPPISDSRSAPVMLLSSPAASILATQARRSCLGRDGISFDARDAARASSVLCMGYSVSAYCRHSAALAERGSPESITTAVREHGFRVRGLRPHPGMTGWTAIISPPPVEDMLEALRRDRQRADRVRHADRGLDRRRDGRADAGDAALARALDAERIERGRGLLGKDHLDRRGLARGRHDVVGEACRQRISAFAVDELLVERAAEPLGEPADDLSLDQRRIDGAADVVADDVALDRDAAGLAVDAHHRQMGAVRIDLVLGVEPAFGREAGLAAAARLRGRREAVRDV